jgi:hypothetical protein
MNKIKLHLEALAVDSFDTTASARSKGTVFGEQCTCYTVCTCPGCPTCDGTCPATCPYTCDGYSCGGEATCAGHTCDGTCRGDDTCGFSCYETCGRTCPV